MSREKPPFDRRSMRLTGYDYTTPGAYFVTICTHRRGNLFDHEPFRNVAENAWRNITRHPHAAHVTLDGWIVMPNHVHGILVISAVPDGVGDFADAPGCRG